jgi:glutathione peroxidase
MCQLGALLELMRVAHGPALRDRQSESHRLHLTTFPPRLIFGPMKLTVVALGTILCMNAIALRAGSLYEIPVKDIDGKDSSLKGYQNKVILIVNVASKCGLTPQYKGLQALQDKYKDKGFTVVGFPCNQFMGQEPGTNEEIKQFCSSKYNVSFPLYDKIDVNGPKRHPLYVALAGKESPFPGDIKWNFGKFLVGRDGKIIKRFEPRTAPDSPEVAAAIEAALAAK